MELSERYSFFSYLKNRHFTQATYAELDDSAIDFDDILKSVHHDPNDRDRALRVFNRVPLSWTWARGINSGKEVLIPLSWFYEINQFNGPAAGNTLEEAIVQGASEVVERHVSALVDREKLVTPDIDIDSIDDEVSLALIDKFRNAGIELYIKDFTLGMGVPTIGALAWDPTTFPQASEIVFTAGTSTDPAKALIRALTEIAQLAGDFNTSGKYIASGLSKPQDLQEASYITSNSSKVALSALPSLTDHNFRTEVTRIARSLRSNGMELYVVNVTHPILQIPATYNIAPGCLFRERARASSVPFFASKILVHTLPTEEAAKELELISEIYPDQYYLEFYRGLLDMEMSNYESALSRFRKALTLDPQSEDIPTIQCQVGACYKDMEDYTRAIAELEKAAVLDGERKEVYNALGFCYFKSKEHEESIRCFENAIRLDPDSAIDYANIGSNLRELERPEEAIRFYNMALELDSSIEFARENVRRLSEKLKQDNS